MKGNEGTIDRAARLVVAAALGIATAVGAVSGTAAVVAVGAAVLLAVTGAAGICPAYLPLGLSTKKGESPSETA